MNFNKSGKEVVDAFSELLNVGVLVCRAFVAVDGDTLIDDVAFEILLLAERLDDELLKVK